MQLDPNSIFPAVVLLKQPLHQQVCWSRHERHSHSGKAVAGGGRAGNLGAQN